MGPVPMSPILYAQCEAQEEVEAPLVVRCTGWVSAVLKRMAMGLGEQEMEVKGSSPRGSHSKLSPSPDHLLGGGARRPQQKGQGGDVEWFHTCHGRLGNLTHITCHTCQGPDWYDAEAAP